MNPIAVEIEIRNKQYVNQFVFYSMQYTMSCLQCFEADGLVTGEGHLTCKTSTSKPLRIVINVSWHLAEQELPSLRCRYKEFCC